LESELKEKLHQGRIGGVLVNDGNRISNPKLYVSQADPRQAAAVTSLVSGVVDKMNLKLAEIKNPPIGLKIEEVSGRTFRWE